MSEERDNDEWDESTSRRKPLALGLAITIAVLVSLGGLAVWLFPEQVSQFIPEQVTQLIPASQDGTNEGVGIGDSVNVEVHRGRNASQLGSTAQALSYVGYVVIEAFHPDGTKFYHHEGHNLLVDEGKEFVEDQLGGVGGTAVAEFVAMSNDGSAPTAGETTCDTEIAANGLSRADGLFTDTGTGTYTITKTFTATGAQSAQKSCLFTDVTNGEPDTLLAMNTFTQVTLANNDQLSVTWTVTIS